MKYQLHLIAATAVSATAGLFATGAEATTTGCVVGVSADKELNLRAGPGTRFQVVGGIDADTCGVFIDSVCVDGFCRVSTVNQSGWASEGFLRRGAKAEAVPSLEWEPLGSRVVDFSRDRDVIQLSRKDGRFRALQLLVSDNDVFMNEIRVVYGNGRAESLLVRDEIKAGRRSRVMDLAGRARIIDRVELIYRSDPGGNRKANVELFGVKFVPPTKPRRRRVRQIAIATPRKLQWEKLGTKSVQGKVDRDTIVVGRREGQYRAVQLVVRNSDIEFEDMKVMFGNGRVQDVPLRSVIRAGASSRVIDLRGQNRIIREVQFVYKRRPNGFDDYARAAVDLYGLHVGAGRNDQTTATRTSARAETTRAHTEIGVLNCEISGGIGFIIGSTKDLTCRFNRPGRDETYFGTIEKFGLDVGATTQGVMSWVVLARTNDVPPGALVGQFAGISGQVTVGAGMGANALVGGSRRSIVLQPVSVQAQLGLNLALGVSELNLRR
ncbi:MAG: DUF992 domain-containing protein [Pseudomonadota bacterium]